MDVREGSLAAQQERLESLLCRLLRLEAKVLQVDPGLAVPRLDEIATGPV